MAYSSAVQFLDNFGVPRGIPFNNDGANSIPMFLAVPYDTQIAEGTVPNHQPLIAAGMTPTVNNTRIDLWEPGGSYVFPPAGGIQMRIISSNAGDAAAGAGIRTVEVHYLDNAGAEQTTTLTMNGITGVTTTPTNIFRIQRMYALTAGANGVASGTIQLQNTAGTVTYAQITTGYTISRQLIWTVPAGFTGYIQSFTFAGIPGAASHWVQFFLRASQTPDGTSTPGIYTTQIQGMSNGSTNEVKLEIPLKLAAGTDVIVSMIGDAAGTGATCVASINGWYEN